MYAPFPFLEKALVLLNTFSYIDDLVIFYHRSGQVLGLIL